MLPYYQLKNVHDIVGFNAKKIDSLGEINAYNSDFHDINSEWIEDSLAEIFHRRKLDNDKDKMILFLYRLLAVKYRIHYPVRGSPLRIDENIQIFLERWICQAFLEYYLYKHPGFKFATN